VAAGDAAAIETLAQWLQHGPPMAEVMAVERSDIDEPGDVASFSIG
jgi:acylphosphatase